MVQPKLPQVIVKDGDDARSLIAVVLLAIDIRWAGYCAWVCQSHGLVEEVYYESVLNVRGIHAMSLEPEEQAQFDKATSQYLATGVLETIRAAKVGRTTIMMTARNEDV
ncbi:hypothetical protein C8R48DRAFT_771533 [Suillus tomentosus]|nr:hypothetical protein C8R48DRAFT_771533 [Suillus tomentosus]